MYEVKVREVEMDKNRKRVEMGEIMEEEVKERERNLKYLVTPSMSRRSRSALPRRRRVRERRKMTWMRKRVRTRPSKLSSTTYKTCLSYVYSGAQAIFHCIPLLPSQYSYSTA